jgi:hypothetical protein
MNLRGRGIAADSCVVAVSLVFLLILLLLSPLTL